MLPFLSEPNRRRINLGGSTSAATHASVLDQAKARRQEREALRRQEQCALQIQAWFRGRSDARRAMLRLQQSFDPVKDVPNALRYILLFGRKDPLRLHQISQTILCQPQPFLDPLDGPDGVNWVNLLRRLSVIILHDIHHQPRSLASMDHLEVLLLLLNPTAYRDPNASSQMTIHLLNNDFYPLIASSIQSIPVEQKNAKTIPPLISLATRPLSNLADISEDGTNCVKQFCSSILTIPLLPNRLPLPSITKLSASLPFTRLSSLERQDIDGLEMEPKLHFLANITTFAAPRYPKFAASILDAYLTLLTTLMNGIPPGIAKAKQTGNTTIEQPMDVDSDDEEVSRPLPRAITSHPSPPFNLDTRTVTRLKSIVSSSHLQGLMSASYQKSTDRRTLIVFTLALSNTWPSHRNQIWDAVSLSSGQRFVREIYRQFVRASPLGKPDTAGAATDASMFDYWPPFLFLTELYNHLLLTMGDDEFFAPPHRTPSNPLTLDEVIAYSRQLLEITFPLYWQLELQLGKPVLLDGLQITWEYVRERCTQCLQALHARDSRRSFTSPGHWHWTHRMDMRSFVDAAIAEDNELEPSVQRLSRRQVASVSPRLGVLNNIPFAIPFDVRVAIFRSFIHNDRRKFGNDHMDFDAHNRRQRVTVRREKIAQDGFDHLRETNLKAHIQITFIDQFGNEEMGIDGGGVFKEFLTSLTKEVFDTDKGLWLETYQRELYPNPHNYATEPHSLNWFNFIGRILGKAIYEGILVDVTFAGFFLAKWLGKESYLDDLASLDQELYRGLIHLKNAQDPESLSLDFTITIEDFGIPRTIDLIPNGSSIPVTKGNRSHYIHLVCLYHLNKKIRRQTEAFFEGLASMVDPKWLRMFNQQEMQLLISGDDSPIDLDDLRANTQYGGLYHDNHPTIQLFWKVAESLDQGQRRALLSFATSCGRPPLLGFKELNPNFAIRDAGTDSSRLPTASTCVNLLKLPLYGDPTTLRDKLIKAIFSGAGFDLS